MAGRNAIAGYAVFAGLIILALAFAFVAFSSTGEQGIEARFSSAVGLHDEGHVSGDVGAETGSTGERRGFFIEGNPALYLLVLGLLAALCVIAYQRFRYQEQE